MASFSFMPPDNHIRNEIATELQSSSELSEFKAYLCA